MKKKIFVFLSQKSIVTLKIMKRVKCLCILQIRLIYFPRLFVYLFARIQSPLNWFSTLSPTRICTLILAQPNCDTKEAKSLQDTSRMVSPLCL